MYFRLTNHFFLHITVPVMLGLSFLIPTAEVFRAALFSAFLHELCHTLAAFALHVPILRLTVFPYGCHLRLGVTDFCTEAKIAAAGPCGSLLLFLLFRHSSFGQINLLLFLFNLIPALPLDGGRILRLVLLQSHGVFFVCRALRRMGVLTGICLSLYALIRPSFFCLCIAVLIFSHTSPSPMPLPILLKKATCIKRVKCFHIRSTDSLLSLTHYFSPFYRVLFIVTDQNKLLHEEDAVACLRQNAAWKVADALRLIGTGKISPLPR
ncbi:MAG: hypothetical protein E7408_02860 [Ruminococcaceae bacterium]|nr:hypothetical protein [Oscillospiraceae bacterium]